jgi:diacylglycerol kinase family enzyme
MRIAPEAKADDGLFHVTLIGDLSLPVLLANLPRLYDGKIAKVRGVHVSTARILEARSAERAFIEADGEEIGPLPAKFEILPQALKIVA